MSQERNHPPVPLTSEDVNPSWVSQIMGMEISTQNFKIEFNIQAGSGFLSSMVRLQCQSLEDESQRFNLVLKLLPEAGTIRDLVTSEGFDKTEINFYQKTVRDLLKIQPDLQQYLCASPYGHIQLEDEAKGQKYASVLALEDLKPKGYYTITFADEESEQQIQEVLTFMAHFHYAGMVLEKNKGGRLPEIYDFLQGASDAGSNSMFFEMARGGFQQLQILLESHAAQPRVIEAYQKMASQSDQIIKRVEAAGKEFACLIHGDLWSNNLLFNDDPNYHTKVIDWQLLGYKDPNYDLGMTILSSIPMKELKKEVVEGYLQYYYNTFVKQCKKDDRSNLIVRDWEEFLKFFSTWGLSYAFFFFLIGGNEPCALNLGRLVKIYEFLAVDAKVPEFLLSQIESL